MFLNKINQNKLTIKNFKTARYNYDSNLIKQSFKNKFVLIYYYDFISKQQESKIKDILNENNLKLIKVKKNLLIMYFRQLKLKFLLDVMKNNTFIIINKSNKPYNRKILTKFNTIQSIHLMGSWFNNRFRRPSEIKKLNYLFKSNVNKQTIKIISLKKNLIKRTLILKKNK